MQIERVVVLPFQTPVLPHGGRLDIKPFCSWCLQHLISLLNQTYFLRFFLLASNLVLVLLPLGTRHNRDVWPLAAPRCPRAPLSSISGGGSRARSGFAARFKCWSCRQGIDGSATLAMSGIQDLEIPVYRFFPRPFPNRPLLLQNPSIF